jgi:hypothetical protein
MDRPSDPVDPVDPEESIDPAEADARFGAELCRELLRSAVGERFLLRFSDRDLAELAECDRAGVVEWLRLKRGPQRRYEVYQAAKRGTARDLADRLYTAEEGHKHSVESVYRSIRDVQSAIEKDDWTGAHLRAAKEAGAPEPEPLEHAADTPFGAQLHAELRRTEAGKRALGRLSYTAIQRLKRCDRSHLVSLYRASRSPRPATVDALKGAPADKLAAHLLEECFYAQPFNALGWI